MESDEERAACERRATGLKVRSRRNKTVGRAGEEELLSRAGPEFFFFLAPRRNQEIGALVHTRCS